MADPANIPAGLLERMDRLIPRVQALVGSLRPGGPLPDPSKQQPSEGLTATLISDMISRMQSMIGSQQTQAQQAPPQPQQAQPQPPSLPSWMQNVQQGLPSWMKAAPQPAASSSGQSSLLQNVLTQISGMLGNMTQGGSWMSSLASSLMNSLQPGISSILQNVQNVVKPVTPTSGAGTAQQPVTQAQGQAQGPSTPPNYFVSGLVSIVGNAVLGKMQGWTSKLENVVLAIRAAGGDKAALEKLKTPENMINALMGRIGSKLGIRGGGMGGVGRNIDAAMGSDFLRGGMRNIAGVVTKIGQTFGGTVFGKVVEYIGKFGEGLAYGIEKVKEWNDRLHAVDMNLALFSGSMAQVMAEFEVQRFRLLQSRGEALAPFAREREAAALRADRAWEPVTRQWMQFQEVVGAVSSEQLTHLRAISTGIDAIMSGEGLLGAVRRIQQLAERLAGEEQGSSTEVSEFLSETASADWAELFGAPIPE